MYDNEPSQGELESTAEEYKLLEQMNRVTATKYSDMRQITSNVAKGVEQLNHKYRELQPYLEQVGLLNYPSSVQWVVYNC